MGEKSSLYFVSNVVYPKLMIFETNQKLFINVDQQIKTIELKY